MKFYCSFYSVLQICPDDEFCYSKCIDILHLFVFMSSINNYLILEATRLTGDVTGRTETTAGRSEPTNHSAASERTRTDQTLRNPERQREGTGTRGEADD